MRVLITGSRTWRDHETIHAALDDLLAEHDLTIVHGACSQGADAIADRWAIRNGVPVARHPAEWRRYQPPSPRRGNPAGFIRNAEMVAAGADVVLAFIRDASRGATHCADIAEKAGIPVRRWTA